MSITLAIEPKTGKRQQALGPQQPTPAKTKKIPRQTVPQAQRREPFRALPSCRSQANSKAPLPSTPKASKAKASPTPPPTVPSKAPPTLHVTDETGKRAKSVLDDPAGIATLNRQAAVLENVFFPLQVCGALSLGDSASITAIRLFLTRFREEAGKAGDAVEKVLLDQLILAHLKVGEMHSLAVGTTNLEFKHLYSNVAAKLVGAICQLVSTLSSYRSSMRSRQHQEARANQTQEPKGLGPPVTESGHQEDKRKPKTPTSRRARDRQ